MPNEPHETPQEQFQQGILERKFDCNWNLRHAKYLIPYQGPRTPTTNKPLGHADDIFARLAVSLSTAHEESWGSRISFSGRDIGSTIDAV